MKLIDLAEKLGGQIPADAGEIKITGVAALRRGRGDRSDPQLGSTDGFTPIADVREASGDSITLGGVRITAHATPGHTPGATSWSWESCEGERCLHMVYADSLECR